MADNLLQQAGNWTVDQLYQVVAKVVSDAQRAHNSQLALRSRLSQLYQRALVIPDPEGRKVALASIDKLTRKLAQQLIDYNNFTATWKATVTKVNDWLRSVGLNPPSVDTLGAVAVVPLAIAGAVAIAAAYVVSIQLKNLAMDRAISTEEKLYGDFMDGRLTWEQYQQASANNQAALDAANKAAAKDNPGAWLDALMPLAWVVAAIVLLPPVLNAVLPARRTNPRRRRRRRSRAWA